MTPEDIRRLRKKLKLTMEQLADKIGVSRMTVHNWEKGLKCPSRLALRRLGELEKESQDRGG